MAVFPKYAATQLGFSPSPLPQPLFIPSCIFLLPLYAPAIHTLHNSKNDISKLYQLDYATSLLYVSQSYCTGSNSVFSITNCPKYQDVIGLNQSSSLIQMEHLHLFTDCFHILQFVTKGKWELCCLILIYDS